MVIKLIIHPLLVWVLLSRHVSGLFRSDVGLRRAIVMAALPPALNIFRDLQGYNV